MTRARPSRKARWAIGLSTVTFFFLVTLGAIFVALGQVISAGGFGDGIGSAKSWADTAATATILDVDVYNMDDEPVPRSFDRRDGAAGYAEVDIKFTNDGNVVDGNRTSVTWMSWPDDMKLPEVGDHVKIVYHGGDPEYQPELATTAGGTPVSILGPSTSNWQGAATGTESTGVTAPVRWTIGVGGLLTLLSLVVTVIWARRADPATPEKGPYPASPYPAPQYPAAQQYPAQSYPAHQYPASQSPAPYPAPQYPASQSPAPYSAPQYPAPQYPTQQYPSEPVGPTEPPPDRLIPPG
jgi:hypothetical protein